MAQNTDKNPRSYDEIVRKAVVDPDSSVRPTLEQEQAAREGFWALDAGEQVLKDQVTRAVASTGITGVTAEVTRDLVTLRGQVADLSLLRPLEDAVASVPVVTTIHDMVVVGPT
jgi:BON domain